MATLVIMAAVGLSVAAIATFWQRGSAAASPTATLGEPPSHLDRADFRAQDTPLLAAVFTAATCASCANVLQTVRAWESTAMAVQEVEVGTDPALHRKYRIDSVPTTVLVDERGEAIFGALGPLSVDDRQQISELVANQ